MKKILILVGVLVGFGARADWEFLPHSRHQQFLTYGLLDEEETGMVFRGGNRAIAELGDSFALLEASGLPGKPQLVLNGSAQFSFRGEGSLLQYYVETFDARFGLFVEFTLDPQLRAWVGLQHVSGHTADGLLDPSLAPLNISDDDFEVRVVRDIDSHFRFGGTLKLMLGTDPAGKPVDANQFAEWFPWGEEPLLGGMQPYVALGAYEDGVSGYQFTYQGQLGILFGNHFKPEKQQSLRLVMGVYHGEDPRLKYAQFFNSRVEFFYFGAMLNL
jgi:hypothetical protein